MDVQLKRRYDLIPNLVNTVKGYVAHEQDTFSKVTEARAKAMSATGLQDHASAENALSGSLKSLFAIAENYPELKADQNFKQLQNELSDTEDKIAFSRQFYNDTVQRLNIKIQMFPSNLVAGMMNLTQEEFFTLEDAALQREPVTVDFSGDQK